METSSDIVVPDCRPCTSMACSPSAEWTSKTCAHGRRGSSRCTCESRGQDWRCKIYQIYQIYQQVRSTYVNFNDLRMLLSYIRGAFHLSKGCPGLSPMTIHDHHIHHPAIRLGISLKTIHLWGYPMEPPWKSGCGTSSFSQVPSLYPATVLPTWGSQDWTCQRRQKVRRLSISQHFIPQFEREKPGFFPGKNMGKHGEDMVKTQNRFNTHWLCRVEKLRTAEMSHDERPWAMARPNANRKTRKLANFRLRLRLPIR